MHILLTGGSGQLGNALRASLSQDRHRVLTPTHAELDLTSHLSIQRYLLRTPQIDLIINSAAIHNVPAIEVDPTPARMLNVDGALYLAKLTKVPYYQISTSYVFGGRSNSRTIPYLESAPTSPINEYGKQKAEVEDKLRPAARIIRLSNLYSSSHPTNFIARILHSYFTTKRSTPIPVVCDQRFQPTPVDVVAEQIANMILLDASAGTYHIAPQSSTSPYDFARIVLARLKLDPKRVVPTPTLDPIRPRNVVLANSKLHPLPHWSDMLLDRLGWF
jgi:dTDP-4-dehydrorhamnose reductase